jgi:hypothetical protein
MESVIVGSAMAHDVTHGFHTAGVGSHVPGNREIDETSYSTHVRNLAFTLLISQSL